MKTVTFRALKTFHLSVGGPFGLGFGVKAVVGLAIDAAARRDGSRIDADRVSGPPGDLHGKLISLDGAGDVPGQTRKIPIFVEKPSGSRDNAPALFQTHHLRGPVALVNRPFARYIPPLAGL